MTTTNKFLSSIKRHQETKKDKTFEGYLKDYLELLEADPAIANLAHRRLYDQIVPNGITHLDESNNRCKKIFDGDST